MNVEQKSTASSLLPSTYLSENSVTAFWQNLSTKLIDLQLNPLIFTDRYYRSKLYKSKFNVDTDDIINAFTSGSIMKNTNSLNIHKYNVKAVIIKEVLFQSNPTLNIINNNIGNVTNPSDGFDNLLDELSINGADTLLIQKQLEEEELKIDYGDDETKQQQSALYSLYSLWRRSGWL